jgi:hypothetical protein
MRVSPWKFLSSRNRGAELQHRPADVGMRIDFLHQVRVADMDEVTGAQQNQARNIKPKRYRESP